MTETTTHDLEAVMHTALAGIASHWAAMMVPTSGGGQGASRGPTTITAGPEPDADDPLGVRVEADHADTEADIDRATRVVSLRRLTTDVLNGWSRVVMEDRPVTTALPDGSSATSMAAFLDRHAQWMSGHDAAQDCADELADLNRRITALVTPRRREWMNLGSCPLKGEDGAACGGRVRAWPRAEDRDGETMARCRTCGTEAVATWWESQMFDDAELKVWLTDADLVTFVHTTFGKVVTEATIRQWVKRKVLSASGSDDKGRRLFHREAVVFALDLHEKRARAGAR